MRLAQRRQGVSGSSKAGVQVQAVVGHFRNQEGPLGPTYDLQLQPDAAAMLAQMMQAMVRSQA